MFGYVKRDKPILDRLTEFLRLWQTNDEECNEDGSRAIHGYQLYATEVSFDFSFKWYVSRDELIEVATHIGEKVKKNQKVVKLSAGEFMIELEQYEDTSFESEGKKMIDGIIDEVRKHKKS